MKRCADVGSPAGCGNPADETMRIAAVRYDQDRHFDAVHSGELRYDVVCIDNNLTDAGSMRFRSRQPLR